MHEHFIIMKKADCRANRPSQLFAFKIYFMLFFTAASTKPLNKRMWTVRSGFEFRMSLCCKEPRVIRNFNHLNDSSIRGGTAEFHAALGKCCTEIIVDFVTVTVSLMDLFRTVKLAGFRGWI